MEKHNSQCLVGFGEIWTLNSDALTFTYPCLFGLVPKLTCQKEKGQALNARAMANLVKRALCFEGGRFPF